MRLENKAEKKNADSIEGRRELGVDKVWSAGKEEEERKFKKRKVKR